MDWLKDNAAFVSVVALIFGALGIPGIIQFFLNLKGAGRKLVVDEGGLSLNQFDKLNAASMALYEAEKEMRIAAEETNRQIMKELQSYKDEREEFRQMMEDSYQMQVRQVNFTKNIILSRSVTLTEDERKELEDTKPVRRRISPKPALK